MRDAGRTQSKLVATEASALKSPLPSPEILLETYPESAEFFNKIKLHNLLRHVTVSREADDLICKYGDQPVNLGPFWTLKRETTSGFDVISFCLAPGRPSVEFNHRELDSGGRSLYSGEEFQKKIVGANFAPVIEYLEKYFVQHHPVIEGKLPTNHEGVNLVGHSLLLTEALTPFTYVPALFQSRNGYHQFFSNSDKHPFDPATQGIFFKESDLERVKPLPAQIAASGIKFNIESDFLFALADNTFVVHDEAHSEKFATAVLEQGIIPAARFYTGLNLAVESGNTTLFAQALKKVVRFEKGEFGDRLDSYPRMVKEFCTGKLNLPPNLFPKTRDEFLASTFFDEAAPQVTGASIVEEARKHRIFRWAPVPAN